MNLQVTMEGLDSKPSPTQLDSSEFPITSQELRSDSPQPIDSLQLTEKIHSELTSFEPESPNIALNEEELATLNDLIKRYDQVIHDLDSLNDQIENLLAEESIKGCDS